MNSRRQNPWLLAAFFAFLYGTVGVLRQRHMATGGFDLGIFEEGVRGYAGLRAPVAALKGTGFNLLGDHFSPVLALIAPFYRLFPCAQTLMLAQAVLFAVSVVPVARCGGLLVGTAYGLSWGLWRAVYCDFHEIAFAVPLAAFALEALLRRRDRAAVLWALPLLLVKEDQGLLVLGIGILVFARGRRAWGAAAVVTALAVTALAVLVLVPALNPGGVYDYADAATGSASSTADPLARLLLPHIKAETVLALLAPTGFLALRSPLVLLAVLPLAARFWDVNPAYWDTGEHYNAVLMPILFLALADALQRLPWGNRSVAWRAALLSALTFGVLMTATMVPSPTRTQPGLDPAAARRVLAVIPDGASVAAANDLAPQLTSRCTVSLFPYLTPPDSAPGPSWRPVAYWVATLDDRPGDFPLPASQIATARTELTGQGYRMVAQGGGVTVYAWADTSAGGPPAAPHAR